MAKDSTLRQRFKPPLLKDNFSDYSKVKSHDSKFDEPPLPTSYLLALLGLLFAVLITVIIIEKQLPPGIKIAEEHKYPDRFISERAYNLLKNLTALGPRVAGSYANEVLAVNLLKREIETIIANAKENNVIQLDVQMASGAFNLAFLDGMTNVYRNMQNIIVRVGSRINSPNSLLLNCHFDTVSQSPGGSDDGAGCAVMMEMLRVLSQSEKILRHNIIFLFNGGEENFMPASHGFITQHKWAKEVRAFINIEACGAGGRELLFQAGPNHPWILETYSEEVPYPYASSLAQEIFQSGLIPGDTDFRIFRDFGNVSGLDFAWSSNGYVYHTRFDTIDQIPLGTLQRTGDNILALARGMAMGHQLNDVERYRPGNLVFFDFLGAFVVRWPMHIADFVNISSVILSFYSIYENMKKAYSTDAISNGQYVKKVGASIVAIFITGLAAILVSFAISFCLNALGRTMSWYARPFWVFFLYVVPVTLVLFAAMFFYARNYHRDLKSSPWVKFRLLYDAYLSIWSFMLIIGIIFRIRSSFLLLFWTLFPAVGSLIMKFVGNWTALKLFLYYVIVMGLPFVQSIYLMIGALYLCFPIMGRAGAAYNSEYLIALLITYFYSVLISYLVPLIILVKSVERVFSLLLGAFLLSIAVLILTPLGFPYSGDPASPAPQRFMMAHVKRTFHDISGDVTGRETGYWIADMDINSPYSVERYVPEVKAARLVDEDCVKYLYCGLPYLVPVQNFIFKTHWIPGPPVTIKETSSLTLVKREKISHGERVTVSITGPFHMGIMVSPVLGVTLERWSLVNEKPLAAAPLWNGRFTYFIYYCYAGDSVPLVFSMDFQVPGNHSGAIMDFGIISHYQFEQVSPVFDNMIKRFPPWTAMTYWTSTVETWIF
uniref:FXNA-like protease n=1 Tax=Photinus pyralis TaxID=7054 RepID=A0A1Y1MFR8_PHOPY